MLKRWNRNEQAINLQTIVYKNRNMQTLKSIGGCVIALVIFVFVWFLSNLALKLLYTLRGDLSTIDNLCRELLSSGFGAYFAMTGVDKILKTYNKNIVFYGFSSVLILFTIWGLYVMIPVREQVGFMTYDFSIQILTPLVAIATAYFTISKISKP